MNVPFQVVHQAVDLAVGAGQRRLVLLDEGVVDCYAVDGVPGGDEDGGAETPVPELRRQVTLAGAQQRPADDADQADTACSLYSQPAPENISPHP